MLDDEPVFIRYTLIHASVLDGFPTDGRNTNSSIPPGDAVGYTVRCMYVPQPAQVSPTKLPGWRVVRIAIPVTLQIDVR